ncbi:hypothetical protein [Methylocystis heyeri]|uniref:Uncharacterized protein n=1 Tax=Methylocystis heyeri TaxID=391905 RepID=A0A6B8KIP1_9HYPH|nr:hypothetical protein [Methylocystis heyeri]QGM46390.1 hypothetical protein H2LOC_012180 [Methylocystis heyeri]
MADEKDYNAVLYEKLYSKLAVALGVGSPERDSTIGESLLSIYNPGQYLPVGLDPIANPEDDQEISQIFDTAPMFNFTYSPVNLRVSQAYSSILQYKLYPIADLSPQEKQKLADAQKSYEELAPACDAAEDNYWDARIPYDEAEANYANGTGPAPTPAMKRAVERALEKWIAAGKIKQETNLAIIKQLQGRDGSAFWDRLDTLFAENQRKLKSGATFPPVTLAPKYNSWFKDAGWTKFSFDQKDMNNQSTSNSIGVAGSLDGKFGIVTLSGSGDYKQDQEYIKVQQTELTFRCELMRVTISRNWMNSLVFNSRAWKFDPTAPSAKYSSGGSIQDRIVPVGPFVSIPTTVILARNVEIIGKFQDTVEERMKRELAANASLGIGPFSISGNVSYRDRKETIKGTIANNLITIKDTQIIAAISQVLPELPNPDPNLPWPT